MTRRVDLTRLSLDELERTLELLALVRRRQRLEELPEEQWILAQPLDRFNQQALERLPVQSLQPLERLTATDATAEVLDSA